MTKFTFRGATPKNHQRRRIDMSRQLRATLRLWRRHQSTVWLKKAQSRPAWAFASTAGTALDESNVRKAFNQILDKAGLHRRGPHQMRHTFGSLLINVGEPVTYVSRQLGHKDSAITLRVYARWLPDETRRRGVDRLDETQPSAPPAQPAQQFAVGQNPVSRWQESGDPNFRELEPDLRLAHAIGGYANGLVNRAESPRRELSAPHNVGEPV